MPQSYPDGTYKGSDGRTYTVRGGVVSADNGSAPRPIMSTPGDPYKAPTARADLAAKGQEAELRRIAIEKARRDLANTPDPTAPAVISPSSNVTGDAYLKTLPATEASTVRGLAQGRLNFPTGTALKSPYWQKMLSNVVNYDPTFEQGDYGARYRLRNDFTSGAAAKNITALNTALSHARELQAAGQALDNFGGWETLLNGPRSAILNAKGDPRVARFITARQAFSDELEKVFAGGNGSVSGRQDWRAMFSQSQSPEQFQASMAEAGKLLGGRVTALQDQYSRGMGPAANIGEFFTDEAKKVYPQLTGAPLPGTAPGGPSGGQGGGGTSGGGGPAGGAPTIRPPSGPYRGPGPGPDLGASGSDGQTVIGTGMNAVPRPEGEALYKEYLGLWAAKASDDTIRRWSQKVYGAVNPDVEAALQARRQGKKINFFAADGLLTKNVPSTDGLAGKIADTAATPLGTFGANFGNAAGMGLPQYLSGTVGGGNRNLTDIRFDTMNATNPNAAGLGQLTGGAAGAAGVEGLATRGLTKLPFVYRGLQGADRAAAIAPWGARLGDGIYGGVSGAASHPDNALWEGLKGVGFGVGGGMAGRSIARGTGNAFRGVTNEAVRTLADRGIPMTTGQILGQSGRLGRAVKGIEDRLSGIPIVGDMVNARRLEGLNAFNRSAFDEALHPVNANTGGVTGARGVDAANNAVGSAYDQALGGVRLQGDQPFVADMGGALRAGAALPEPMATRAGYTLNTRVGNSFGANGEMTGNGFQQSLRGLRGDARTVAREPYGNDFGAVTGQAEDALTGLLRRQSPGTMEQYNAANAAYRRTGIVRDAVDAAKNGTGTGEVQTFTPAQLATAASRNAKRFGGTQGTTDQPFFGLTEAGQTVLPNRVPDSGTAGRFATLALPGILGGSGAGVDYATGTSGAGTAGLALGGLLTAGGSRRVQRIIQAALLDRPDAFVRIGNQIQRRQALGGMFGAPILLGAQR